MELSGLYVKMLIFITLMLIGYIFARRASAGLGFTSVASRLVLNVFMCATILNSVVSGELELSGPALWNALAVVSVSMVICYIVGAISSRLIPLKKDEAPCFELLISVTNNMFIAMPVLQALYGQLAVFYCSLSCISYNLMLYTYGTWRLNGGGKLKLKESLSMPLLSTLAALAIFLTRLPMPRVAVELLSTMSGATMPLSMVVIGASLAPVKLTEAFKSRSVYIMCAIRLVVVPLIAFLVIRLMTDDHMLLVSAVILAGCPSGIVTTALSIRSGRDGVYTSKGILVGTILSMLTMPAALALLG